MTTDIRSHEPAPGDELLTAKQIAEIMKVHVATVYRLADSGDLRAMRFGRGESRRRGFRCWKSVVLDFMRDSEYPAEEVAA
ncbi:helix-turn-helix domain-containing protein [Streptomyces sp. NPDC058869]|uniref:helix-turn-helix domain-containing protein n=1 Tax=Streptomyces sp. NPDC058869 TaxID=3346659 RepID=UPI00368A26BE